MKYAMCPKCGRRLCKGENGTKVEMECPKCGEFASVIIEEDDIHISKKPIFTTTQDKQLSSHCRAIWCALHAVAEDCKKTNAPLP